MGISSAKLFKIPKEIRKPIIGITDSAIKDLNTIIKVAYVLKTSYSINGQIKTTINL